MIPHECGPATPRTGTAAEVEVVAGASGVAGTMAESECRSGFWLVECGGCGGNHDRL